MKFYKRISAGVYFVLVSAFFLAGCGQGEEIACDKLPENPAVEDIAIVRLDQQLMSSESRQEVEKMLSNHPVFARVFLSGDEYPDKSILSGKLYGLSNDRSIDTLYRETLDRFGDLEQLKGELKTSYSWLNYYYPSAGVPRVKTAISGFYNDLYVSDSLLIIGLDYFVGTDATFQPLNTPHYILKRYEKESILPLIFSFVSNDYMAIDQRDNTLLADILNYGRSFYFTQKMMPCKSEKWIIGYDDEEMRLVNANQETIWAHFIDRKLLFETSHFVKSKYIGERPNVFEIGDQCPGRIGRWLGWEIVKAYMERNPEVTLQELMMETDVQKILNKSKFKAKNK